MYSERDEQALRAAAPEAAKQQEREYLPAQVVSEEEGAMLRWTNDSPVAASNLDQSGPAGRALVTQALASSDLRTRDVVGQTLEVVGYVAHVAEVEDPKTGECLTKLRVVMILNDGRQVSTMSAACIRTLRYLAKSMPTGRWEPPLRLQIKSHPLEGGKSYCDLRELPPDAATAGKPKK